MDKQQVGTRSVERTRSEQRAKVAAVQTAAFIKDPLVRYIYPDIDTYLRHGPALFDAYGGDAVDQGTAFHTEGISGSALWFAPGRHGDDERIGRLIEETVAPERKALTYELFAQMEANHPTDPHWFLPLIGVDPHHQGMGLGGALLADMTARLDAEGLPAHLDCSNVLNIPLYERHGFEIVDEIRIDGLSPFWPMRRRPR